MPQEGDQDAGGEVVRKNERNLDMFDEKINLPVEH